MTTPDDDDEEAAEYARARGFMPSAPDPTKLTTDAVRQAVEVSRREIIALRETLETRMNASDQDRLRVWERLRDLPNLYEVSAGHLRDEIIALADHNREVITQRLNDLDKASLVAAERIERIPADNTADAKALADVFKQSMGAEREYVMSQIDGLRVLLEQRLSAMDTATKVLADSVAKFPTDVDRAVGNSREVLDGEIRRVQAITTEKFQAIDGTFSSNALALTAALAAQKEAAAEQNKSNTLAITKSESSTKETIAANAVQAQTGLASLENQFDDIKARVIRIESLDIGARQESGEHRADRTDNRGTIMAIIASISVVLAIISFVAFTIKK